MMCLICEQDDLRAAYRAYRTRRTAAQAFAADHAAHEPGVPVDEPWAEGTWFAVKRPSGA